MHLSKINSYMWNVHLRQWRTFNSTIFDTQALTEWSRRLCQQEQTIPPMTTLARDGTTVHLCRRRFWIEEQILTVMTKHCELSIKPQIYFNWFPPFFVQPLLCSYLPTKNLWRSLSRTCAREVINGEGNCETKTNNKGRSHSFSSWTAGKYWIRNRFALNRNELVNNGRLNPHKNWIFPNLLISLFCTGVKLNVTTFALEAHILILRRFDWW